MACYRDSFTLFFLKKIRTLLSRVFLQILEKLRESSDIYFTSECLYQTARCSKSYTVASIMLPTQFFLTGNGHDKAARMLTVQAYHCGRSAEKVANCSDHSIIPGHAVT
jgi:hypothetical protein